MTRRSLLMMPLVALGTQDWVAADGSEFPHASWKVNEDGLQAVGGLKTFQDIKTVKLYEDFVFEFEWKMLAEGNSGVKYQLEKFDRWQPKGLEGFHIRARGPEMQLVDDARNADAQKGPLKQCGSLYNTVATIKPAQIRIGEFNTARLVVRGMRAEHWINGEKLVDYELKSKRPSAISLQNHACDVWFRNLRIRG
jgi:hypothetical protein